ncbi:MAG: amidase domain-containing protein [Eubacteriales bacterium]
MFKWLYSKQMLFFIGLILCIIIALGMSSKLFEDNELEKLASQLLDDINTAYLAKDEESLKNYYHTDVLYGKWAYEYAVRKIKYIENWSKKQNIQFTEIKSEYTFYNITGSDQVYNLTVKAIDSYYYKYPDEEKSDNCFRIAVYHYMRIEFVEDRWIITKDWFSDPMSDTLTIDENKMEGISNYIEEFTPQSYKLTGRRKDAVTYADKYSSAVKDSSYNNKYRNYNPVGGDCANFASQILYEGGKFKKNSIWNYDKGGSMTWIKAQNLTEFLLYNGRASKIAVGSYTDVYKAAYKLQPGDIVAYEEKGDIKHISVVTGYDSKGYPMVNCHNVDRYHVPWDIGWNRKGITYWLVRVHY